MTLLDLLYLPAAAITAPWWARKTRSGWGERFGHIEPVGGTGLALQTSAPPAPRILLHAVSVGEVTTLRNLVPLLTEHGCEVVISVSTDTGIKRARELFEPPTVPLPSAAPESSTNGKVHIAAEGSAARATPSIFVTRYPLDFSPAVHRFLDAVRPDAVALVELEVWPNFVRACTERSIPIGVINGRLSARSFRGYHRFRRFFHKTFASLAFVGAQDAAYADRFRAMGVPESRLSITGSMKWDADPGTPPLRGGSALGTPTLRGGLDSDILSKASKLARDLGINPSLPLIVAGSTAPIEASDSGFDCEEALLHAACPENVQLLCALRKPEHYEKALQALGGKKHCTRRSASPAHLLTSSPAHPPHRRFLLDTIGELRTAYALADIAVIGRTWGNLGGSDPIEPIALGKPTILGPRYANFESIVQTFAAAGAIVITDAARLPQELRDLLNDPARRAELPQRGQACIAAQQGATQRHADLILSVLRPAPSVSVPSRTAAQAAAARRRPQ